MLAMLTTRSEAQVPPLSEKYFSSYARAHRVTIRRNGNVVTTFEIPVGVYLSIYSDQPPVRSTQEGRVEFHGNVEVRTRPRSEVDFSIESTNAEVTMAKAPLVVAAQNVDVVSETLIP
jgi:hypothetical protein